MKKILFFASLPLLFAAGLLIGIVGSLAVAIIWLCEQVFELCHRWEGFCFNYDDEWEYLGGGIWKGKSDE